MSSCPLSAHFPLSKSLIDRTFYLQVQRELLGHNDLHQFTSPMSVLPLLGFTDDESNLTLKPCLLAAVITELPQL
jgi:hypothetical protein